MSCSRLAFWHFPEFNLGSFIILASCFLLTFSSCCVTNSVVVETWQPATVSLEQKISRIGIINQSEALPGSPEDTGLQSWVQHSDIEISENVKQTALNSLYQELANDSRFDTILLLPGGKSSTVTTFNESHVPWEEMRNLCDQYGLDAIFALAYNQTDTKISLKKAKFYQRDLIRANHEKTGHELKLETLIEQGWRIYDPYQKRILDEIAINNQMVSKGRGEDPYKAFEAIDYRLDSLAVLGKNSGTSFGSRVKPYIKQEEREYFTKGTYNLEKADSLVQSEQWKEASKMWEQDLDHPDPKISGRAHLNMAVVNELYGDLESAMNWASKSHEIHDSRYTRKYLASLNRRISSQQQIEEYYLH